MTEDQIKYMVDRFLSWKLPTNFSPDAGISFKAEYNEHTVHPARHVPTGTNLFDATQAEAMVRYMLAGVAPTETLDTAFDRVFKMLGVVSSANTLKTAKSLAIETEAELRNAIHAGQQPTVVRQFGFAKRHGKPNSSNASHLPGVKMTDETKPVELLPCPFCGVMPTVQPKGRVRSFMIFCANEECFGPHTTAAEEADARYQWNTRTTPPQQLSSTLIDRLQSCVKNVEGSFPTSYDFFRAIKNEGPGTGWRYETVGIGISDIKECLAAMTSKPYEHAMKRGRISNERHR